MANKDMYSGGDEGSYVKKGSMSQAVAYEANMGFITGIGGASPKDHFMG